MAEKTGGSKARIGLMLILLLFLAGIGFFSNQPASQQDMKPEIQKHTWVIKAVNQLPQIRFNYEGRVIDSRQDAARFVQFSIRKLIHFVSYGILGMLVLWNISSGRRPNWRHYSWAALVVLVVAVLDEWHQLSVPGRCGLYYDVGLDMAGYICFGVLSCFLWARHRVNG